MLYRRPGMVGLARGLLGLGEGEAYGCWAGADEDCEGFWGHFGWLMEKWSRYERGYKSKMQI